MNICSLTRLAFALSVLAMLPCALSACADLDDETVADNPPPASVEQAPPQTPEPEIVPMLSNPQGELWRPGYWAMIDGNFVWIPGKIIPRPSPTAAWATARWVHHAYGWSFEMGHWE